MVPDLRRGLTGPPDALAGSILIALPLRPFEPVSCSASPSARILTTRCLLGANPTATPLGVLPTSGLLASHAYCGTVVTSDLCYSSGCPGRRPCEVSWLAASGSD